MFLGEGLGLAVAALCERIFLALVCLAIKDGTNCLLAGGVVGGGIEQLVGTGGMASHKLVHQVPACRAFEEGVDDLDVGDAGELGALLGEAQHVVAQGFIGLLPTPFEVPGVPRAHVSALEVVQEDLDLVGPVVDLVRGQVLEPHSRGVSEVKGEVADDDRVVRRTAQLAC